MSVVVFDRHRSRTGRPRLLYVENCKKYYAAEIYPMEERINMKEAAEFLDVSTRTLYRKIKRHEIPVMRDRNNYYFSINALLKFLEELGKDGRK